MSDAIDALNAALEGCYRIERELGEGGTATVYLARDEKHDRNVALKVLKPELAVVVGAERFLARGKTTAGSWPCFGAEPNRVASPRERPYRGGHCRPPRFAVDATVLEIWFDQSTAGGTSSGFGLLARCHRAGGSDRRMAEPEPQWCAHRLHVCAAIDSGPVNHGDRFQFLTDGVGTWEYVEEMTGAPGTLTAS